MRKAALLAGLIAAGASASARAQTSGAAFLQVDPSPRSYALGGADAIADPGAQALDRNPSLVGLMMTRYEAFGAYQTLISGAQYEHLAFAAHPDFIDPYVDAVGFAFTRLDISGIPGADAQGNNTGSTFSAGDTALAFGAAKSLLPNLRVGADLKGVQSQIASYSSNWALAFDFGATWTPPLTFMERPLTVAACLDDIGQGQKFLSQTDPLPAAFKLAVAVPVFSYSTTFFQLRDLIYDHAASASAGLEYTYKIISIRGGYSYQFNGPSNLALADQSSIMTRALGGLTGGIGLQWGALTFDYAVGQQAADYGATQRVALSVAWGRPGGAAGYEDIRSSENPEPAQREPAPAADRPATDAAPAPAAPQPAQSGGVIDWFNP